MIYFLKGKVIEKLENSVVINVNGVGYSCIISSSSFDRLPDSGKDTTIFTFLHITESSHTLYGFMSLDEKGTFEKLITVSGIGPKIAISILSSVRVDELIDRIIQGKVDQLTKLPGIGPKTAKRIIIELKDKFQGATDLNLPIESNKLNSNQIDAYKAIKTLYQGLSKEEIDRYIIDVTSSDNTMSVEAIIKGVLLLIKQS